MLHNMKLGRSAVHDQAFQSILKNGVNQWFNHKLWFLVAVFLFLMSERNIFPFKYQHVDFCNQDITINCKSHP